jgi:hypothetical protein
MPRVLITFHDGESLYAETPEITFELPVLEVEVRNVGSNSARALVPVGAMRQILVGEVEPAPPAEEVAGWDRAAFHFLDGHVLRASIAPEVHLGRHGGVWRMVQPDDDEMRTLAIPYTSLKGVFQIRQWDSRPLSQRGPGPADHLEHTISVFAEREAQATRQVRRRPRTRLLDRMKRTDSETKDDVTS